MKNIKFILIVFVFVIVSCTNNGGLNNVENEEVEIEQNEEVSLKKRENIQLTKVQKEMIEGTTDFAFKMLQVSIDKLDKDYILLSPFSTSMALSMLANGAARETRQEIIDVLGFEGKDIYDINEYSRKLLSEISELDNTSVLCISNSMWLNEGYGTGFYVYDWFRDQLNSFYEAEIHSYDFKNGPGPINEWCNKKTNGLIPEIIKTLDPYAQMALTNALYFKGIWQTKFMESNTEQGSFNNEDGSSTIVQMMSQRKSLSYLSTDNYTLAELPYGNEAFKFQILLPAEDVCLEECLSNISGDDWLAAQSMLTPQNLEITVPKFKLEMNESINSVIETLGIRKIFYANEVDFSNMSDEESVVSFIQQATSLSVDEDGSEAAAVTIVGMVSSSGPGHEKPEYIPFNVNRPFIFLIKEVSTNSILFIGKISQL